MTESKPIATDPHKQQPVESEAKDAVMEHKRYESMTDKEFMAIYKSLVAIQDRLSHPEFGFMRYLLEMTIREFTMPGKPGEPLTKPGAAVPEGESESKTG